MRERESEEREERERERERERRREREKERERKKRERGREREGENLLSLGIGAARRLNRLDLRLLRQYLYFCTRKASKLSPKSCCSASVFVLLYQQGK